MAGWRYLLQQRLRFSIPSGTPAASQIMFPLAGIGIPSVAIISGTLEVIIYDKGLNNGVTATVAVANMARTGDGKFATQDGQAASVAITSGSDSNTRLLLGELTPPIGSMLGGILMFETAQNQSGDGDVELEVWLTVRDALT